MIWDYKMKDMNKNRMRKMEQRRGADRKPDGEYGAGKAVGVGNRVAKAKGSERKGMNRANGGW